MVRRSSSRATAGHSTYANVVATVALFVALGGGAYAATQLPAKSVGTRQIKDGAVTPSKLRKRPFVERLPSGKTLRGAWYLGAYVEGGGTTHQATDSISFGHRLSEAPSVQVIPPNGASTAACPGSVEVPSASPGYLCIYTGKQYGTVFDVGVLDTRTNTKGASPFGAGLYIYPNGAADTAYGAQGTWAVRAK